MKMPLLTVSSQLFDRFWLAMCDLVGNPICGVSYWWTLIRADVRQVMRAVLS